MTQQQANATKWILGVAGAFVAAVMVGYWADDRQDVRDAIAQNDKMSAQRHLTLREEMYRALATQERTAEKIERRVEKLEDAK